MINSVTVTNPLGESVTMELRFPEKSGFLIQSIEGIGPNKASINITELSVIDGGLFNAARMSFRNIVFSIIFLENPTIEITRRNSYKYFPIKKKIKISIETDTRSVEIYGYVESNEPNIFSNQEGSTISVICPDPYLYDINLQRTVFASITSLFEFPFSNESLTENLIEFSELSLETSKSIYYDGDEEVGLLIYIHAFGPANDVEIIYTETLDSISIDSAKLIALTGEDIHLGDDIYISTVKGNKYAILVRDGETINILNTLSMSPTWFQLKKGDNVFTYNADSGLTNLQFEIVNSVIYEGV